MHHLVDGEAPDRVEAEADAGAAEQGAEVVAHGLADEGDEADPAEGQALAYGLEGEPVVAHEDEVVDDGEQEGKPEPGWRNLVDGGPDLGEAVGLELVVKQIDGQHEDGRDEHGCKESRIFFHQSCSLAALGMAPGPEDRAQAYRGGLACVKELAPCARAAPEA